MKQLINSIEETKHFLSVCDVWDNFYRPKTVKRTVTYRNDRFVVICKRSKRKDSSYVYTIIDTKKRFMWPHDWLFRDNDMRVYEDCEELMKDFVEWDGTYEETHISRRNWCSLVCFNWYRLK